MTVDGRQRLEELLADQTLWGLPDAEKRELFELRQNDDLREFERELESEFEELAALTTIGLVPQTSEQVPDAVVQKLEAEALGFVATRRGLSTGEILAAMDSTDSRRTSDSSAPAPIAWGWLLAAAAVLVGVLWAGFFREWTASPTSSRGDVLAMSDSLKLDWATGPSPLSGTASGDIVWNDRLQTGYMRFRGLPVNDANAQQYQLWIFDETRDKARPVDGGVFDVSERARDANGDVIVPIRAAIRVGEGVAFAVTVERPGGVVVSDREHIVATAGL